MKSAWLSLSPLLLPLLCAPLASQAEPPKLRTGIWEVTTRAQSATTPSVHRECIADADLMQLVHGRDTIEDDPCTLVRPPKATSRRWSVDLRCQDGSQLHAEFNVPSSQRLAGTVVRIGGKRLLAQRVDISGRWLADSCKARP